MSNEIMSGNNRIRFDKLVHNNGNENIEGIKKFKSYIDIDVESTNGSGAKLNLIDKHLKRGTVPSLDWYQFPLDVRDIDDIRMCALYHVYKTDKSNSLELLIYKGTDNTNTFATLGIGYDSNGNVFTSCPNPPAYSNTTAIATTNWVQNYWKNNTVYFSKYPLILGTSNNLEFGICAGSDTGAFSGAKIVLYGASHSNAGMFDVQAGNSSGYKQLLGYANGTLKWNGQAVQTSSDKRLKTNIKTIDNTVLDSWEKVQWNEFKFKDAVSEKGDNARKHIGLIAQDVVEIFENNNLDICDYGICCHEQREATNDEEAFEQWMVRYTEALAMEAAYQRRKNKQLEYEIALLKEEINLLKEKVK